MEYSPPPLFKQGASARAKVVIFSLVAIGLLLGDAHFNSLKVIRQFVGTALYPLQQAALLPRDAAYTVIDYFSSVSSLRRENRVLESERAANALILQQAQLLSAENAQLRKLMAANERLPVKSVLSEILYDARDAYSRKVVLDRGSKHGVTAGQPVIDDVGVVGQVTRVFPFTSEVTLLSDKDQAIPVQVVRSGVRSIVYGQGHGGSLDLRFMPVNADIRNGDVLVTSGIDGVYPAGLAVARVVQVESKSSDAFARIICQPIAGINRNRQLLILLNEPNFPPRPPPVETGKDKALKKGAAPAPDAARQTDAPPAAAGPATPAASASSATPAATTPAVAPAGPAASATAAASTNAPGAAARTTSPAAPAPSTGASSSQRPATPSAAPANAPGNAARTTAVPAAGAPSAPASAARPAASVNPAATAPVSPTPASGAPSPAPANPVAAAPSASASAPRPVVPAAAATAPPANRQGSGAQPSAASASTGAAAQPSAQTTGAATRPASSPASAGAGEP